MRADVLLDLKSAGSVGFEVVWFRAAGGTERQFGQADKALVNPRSVESQCARV
ncbi:hypothetical protein [Mycobacteroides abscessus]|uniref:hypothetical protein n=1 Tax=Mycobacteroides abscessus TaxID=36809 RepID=UPI001F4910ED|nr:hypothetical protein [Mycobacteroides abscessus]